MRHFIIAFSAALVLSFLASSCSKMDDFLDKAPSSDVSYVATIADCDKLLNNPYLLYGFEHTYVLDDGIEFRDVEKAPGFKAGNLSYILYSFWPSGSIFKPSEDDACWNNIYRNVYYYNVVLSKIDNVSGNDPVKRSQIKGEALLSRAYCHFSLVNLYSKQYSAATASKDAGIPYVMDVDVQGKRERGTVANVYDLVIDDITNALANLKADKPTPGKNFRGSKAAAYALLAKVYFYKQNWAEAIANANKSLELYSDLIDLNQFADFRAYETASSQPVQPFFNAENVLLRGSNSGSSMALKMSVEMGALLGGLHLSSGLAASIDQANDLRYRLFMGKSMTGDVTIKKNKLNDPLVYAFSNTGISLSDIYLILAESYARNNDVTSALSTLNTYLKSRYDAATFAPYAETDSKAVIAKIITERSIEQVYTGHRWFEMRRLFALGEYSTSVVRKNVKGEVIGTLVPSANRLVLPIPAKITSLNPNITPNPTE